MFYKRDKQLLQKEKRIHALRLFRTINAGA